MDQRTPRRLGLSRISPRTKPNPQMKRSNEPTNTVPTTTSIVVVNKNIEITAETAEVIDSLVTPTKKRKVSLGRFDFTPKQQQQQQTNELNEEQHETYDTIDAKTVDKLKAEIQEMKEVLQEYEKYTNEEKELQQLIETWKVGGIQALRQLQVEIQPKQEIEQILEHFKLPADIFGTIIE